MRSAASFRHIRFVSVFCKADGRLLNIRLATVNADQIGALGARRREVGFVCGSFCSAAGAALEVAAAGAVTCLIAALSAAGAKIFAIIQYVFNVVGFIAFDTANILRFRPVFKEEKTSAFPLPFPQS